MRLPCFAQARRACNEVIVAIVDRATLTFPLRPWLNAKIMASSAYARLRIFMKEYNM
jgi:hypothetical protein